MILLFTTDVAHGAGDVFLRVRYPVICTFTIRLNFMFRCCCFACLQCGILYYRHKSFY